MVTVGSFIVINQNVIDNNILRFRKEGKSKSITRWESYRNTVFEVLEVQQNERIQIRDFHGQILELNARSYSEATGLGKI